MTIPQIVKTFVYFYPNNFSDFVIQGARYTMELFYGMYGLQSVEQYITSLLL